MVFVQPKVPLNQKGIIYILRKLQQLQPHLEKGELPFAIYRLDTFRLESMSYCNVVYLGVDHHLSAIKRKLAIWILVVQK